MSVSRRKFLNTSVGVAAALTAGQVLGADEPVAKKPASAPDTKPAKPAKKKKPVDIPAGEKIMVGIIGCGGRAQSHLSDLLGLSDHVQVVAVCDCDEKHVNSFAGRIEDETGESAAAYTDVRKMLEHKGLQAVSIATPNHWHTLAAIWAIQAGMDVYVEKPCSHNVAEGRRLVEFARKHNKIVLHGTQSRSTAAMNQGIKFMHDGGIGKVQLARGTCYKRRQSIGKTEGEQKIPAGVDYDLWCGPAPLKPLTRQKLHYDWHWFWDYGNGDLGNQGVHQMDICLWGLGKTELPKRVQSLGGRLGYIDDGQTPNSLVTVLDFDDCQTIFEVRGLETKPLEPAKGGVANIFYGDKGKLVVNSYESVAAFDNNGKPIELPPYEGDANGNHFVTFIKAVKTRKLERDRGEIEVGHLSSAMCHLGNISYRLGEKTTYEKGRQAMGDDKDVVETLARFAEHLKDNSLNLDDSEYVLGPSLTFDPKTETFPGNEKANALLTRQYRAPFVVPDKVS